MWCPIDCVHFHEILENCERVALSILPLKAGQENVYIDSDYTRQDYENSYESRRQVIANTILKLFLNKHRYKALAASRDGQLVKLSPHIVRPPLFNHSNRIAPPFTDYPSLLYVDISSGLIDPINTSARMAQAYSSMIDGITDDIAESIFSPEEREPKTYLHMEERAVEEFGHLSGWAVCYKCSEVCYSVPELMDFWNEDQFHLSSGQQDQLASPGRPRLQEDVAMAYKIKFPEGHTGTWKEALKSIEPLLSRPVSLDTLMRSIGKKK